MLNQCDPTELWSGLHGASWKKHGESRLNMLLRPNARWRPRASASQVDGRVKGK